ncbi:polysaccharide deacetylase family protein [Bacillus salipaludis]|uniref:Polysaccharide deacetylase family protein n=1 Tax=Bacillus salipaludis TaxID=2547811 RepID=A0AA90TWN1_9BACI|nr:polysaccharide deacetylase family protein [Bacillus salipaludis]MDQ6600873.1 polysaccharide deacetylase family protein [Bacillus salipaludis]
MRMGKNSWVKGTFLCSLAVGIIASGAFTIYNFSEKVKANEPSIQKDSRKMPLKKVGETIYQVNMDDQFEKERIQEKKHADLGQKQQKVDEETHSDEQRPTAKHPVPNHAATKRMNTPNSSKQETNVVPPKEDKSKTVYSSKRTIYLTFDDGPESYTEDILASLEKYHFKATFFMLDGNIKRYPNAVKEMVTLGDSIGIHGVTHNVKLFYASEKSVLGEINQTNPTLKTITGEDSYLIRTPYGSYPYMTEKERKAVSAGGYMLWDWNIDSQDWYYKDERFVKNVINQLKQKSKHKGPIVILMHEKKETLKYLPKLLDYLSIHGYEGKAISSSMSPVHF